MGSGRWDDDAYKSAKVHRIHTHTPDFAYSSVMASTDPVDRKAHATMDPRTISASVTGVRESRDSDDHPESLPVVVLFDVTGSMHYVPRVLQQKLCDLMGLLTTKGGVPHPHVLVGAIGDATCDRVPFQVGQFESDNRIDDQIRNIYLEGGGGGQDTESYELGLFFAARLTSIDSFEKRGKKGYLFIIGDERFYPEVDRHQVKATFDISIEKSIPIREIMAEVQEKFEVFYVMPKQGSYWEDPRILDPWGELLGQHVLKLEDADMASELIASTVALYEGATTAATVGRDMGLADKAAKVVSTALAPLAAGGALDKAKATGARL